MMNPPLTHTRTGFHFSSTIIFCQANNWLIAGIHINSCLTDMGEDHAIKVDPDWWKILFKGIYLLTDFAPHQSDGDYGFMIRCMFAVGQKN